MLRTSLSCCHSSQHCLDATPSWCLTHVILTLETANTVCPPCLTCPNCDTTAILEMSKKLPIEQLACLHAQPQALLQPCCFDTVSADPADDLCKSAVLRYRPDAGSLVIATCITSTVCKDTFLRCKGFPMPANMPPGGISVYCCSRYIDM